MKPYRLIPILISLLLIWLTPITYALDNAPLTLSIGVPAYRYPYSYADNKQQASGILIEVLKGVCERLKATCSFNIGTTDDLLPDLQALKLNAVLILDTFIVPEVDNIQLSRPLCTLKPVFIQNKQDPPRHAITDYKGTRIAVLEGSIYQIYLLDTYSQLARIKPYLFLENAIFDLVYGRVDALLTEDAFMQERIKNTSLWGYHGFTLNYPTPNDLSATAMTLAVRNQDTDLFKQLDKALPTTKDQQPPACSELLKSTTPDKGKH